MSRLLSHLVYLEIGSPAPAESARFYTEKFGMRIVEEHGDTYYLRCWGDHQRYSLIVSPASCAVLKTMAWRTAGEDELHAAVARIESVEGITGRWAGPARGRGWSYSFDGPFGHNMTLVWEIDEYVADPEHRSVLPDRPERRSTHGAAPRFLDHLTIASCDVKASADWYATVLGFRIMAHTTLDDAPVHVFSVLTTNEKSHDLGIVLDTSDTSGRVHHIAFWVDHPEDLVRTADLMIENGVPIEYGPSVHGIGEQHYLYFREPSTLRVEVNSGGYRNYVPDWRPRTWKPSDGSNNLFRNWSMPDSMTEAFPAAEGRTTTEQDVSPELESELSNPWSTTANTTTS